MVRAATALAEVADRTEPEQRMLSCYLTGAAAAFSGHWLDARQPAAQALELLEGDPSLRDDPRYLVHALTAGVWMGEAERALVFVDRRERRARETGAIGLLPFALTLLAGGAMVLGDHWRAFAYADEAVQLGTDLGYAVDVSTAHELLAAQLAARGRPRQAMEALDEARRLAAVAGVADAAVQVQLVEAFAALCRGDVQVTVAVLEGRLETDGGRLPNGDYELSVAPDLVEAYLALGRHAEAAGLAQRHAELHHDSPSPLARAHARRLVGMTATGPQEATAAFEAAVTQHHDWPDPFEAARTRLAYGARLRRDGTRRAARAQLTAARTAFEAIGFAAWTDRTQQELEATGQRARRGPAREVSLTAQEARVALLVARGMTNREIAASLFLSPKTVEHHVTAALRKTGVRTRTELAVALSTDSAAPHPTSAARDCLSSVGESETVP
jgi:DNA-binding CsgD family transcriptional regulator/tetratricopeptide (TPR) repeat protein